MMTAVPFQAEQPIFARMGELANYANLSYEEQERYMRSLDTWRTNVAAENFSYIKGEKKGFEKGRAEGRAEGFLLSAAMMMESGMKLDEVAAILKLTEQQKKMLHDNC